MIFFLSPKLAPRGAWAIEVIESRRDRFKPVMHEKPWRFQVKVMCVILVVLFTNETRSPPLIPVLKVEIGLTPYEVPAAGDVIGDRARSV